MRAAWSVVVVVILAISLSGCSYNTTQAQDEQVKAGWSEVVNQYQRRADLVPNLISMVKDYAGHEKEVLMEVTEARARVDAIQASPALLDDPQVFARSQSVQQQLTGSLSRLPAVSENYPQLKADAGFRDLQAQLEGTENRITITRNRYTQSVQSYNMTVRSSPSNLTAKAFGYQGKPNFTVVNETATARLPQVELGSPSASALGSSK